MCLPLLIAEQSNKLSKLLMFNQGLQKYLKGDVFLFIFLFQNKRYYSNIQINTIVSLNKKHLNDDNKHLRVP